MKKFIASGMLMLVIFLVACSPSQQVSSTLSEAEVSELLASQEYRFNARFVQPQGARSRVITGTYTLKVSKSLVEADLPYFGRAYNAPIGSSDVGMKFRSERFSYTSTEDRKGRKTIHIKPEDAHDIQDVYLTVFPNGAADLRITSVSRQGISYTGELAHF